MGPCMRHQDHMNAPGFAHVVTRAARATSKPAGAGVMTREGPPRSRKPGAEDGGAQGRPPCLGHAVGRMDVLESSRLRR